MCTFEIAKQRSFEMTQDRQPVIAILPVRFENSRANSAETDRIALSSPLSLQYKCPERIHLGLTNV